MNDDGLIFDITSPSNDEPRELYNTRELLIFVIDCSDSMFEVHNDEESYFKKYLRACRAVLMRKIIGSSSDYVGILFYGTREKDDGNHNPNHVLTFFEPKQPNADIIKQIDIILSSDDAYFNNKYGHSNDYSISDVLWRCSSLIGRCSVNFSIKKIGLMTCNDQPHRDDPVKQHHTYKKAEDLESLKIQMDVLGIRDDFDEDLFYNEILKMIGGPDSEVQKGKVLLDQLMIGNYRKDFKKRSFGKLIWHIGKDVSLAVEVYGFYRSLKVPAIRKLCRKTNEVTKSVSQIYDAETGERLLKSDLNYKIDINGETITFSIDEKEDLRILPQAGIKLLGFMSLVHLSPEYQIQTSSFIYPNDEIVRGSTTLFNALLESCHDKGKFALCYFLARIRSKPKLVALVPQREIQDDVQIVPPGFHVIYLPFAENIREVEFPPKDPLDEYNIELCKKIMKKLRIKYKVSLFENPKIQTHWANIEALALNYPERRNFEDKTLPDFEFVSKNRLNELETTFADTFYKDGYDPETENIKKRSHPSSYQKSVQKRKKIDPEDPNYIEKMAEEGQLDKVTIPILKQYLMENDIPVKGFKKPDYLNAVSKLLSKN